MFFEIDLGPPNGILSFRNFEELVKGGVLSE